MKPNEMQAQRLKMDPPEGELHGFPLIQLRLGELDENSVF